jgi:hypothetical protein
MASLLSNYSEAYRSSERRNEKNSVVCKLDISARNGNKEL